MSPLDVLCKIVADEAYRDDPRSYTINKIRRLITRVSPMVVAGIAIYLRGMGMNRLPVVLAVELIRAGVKGRVTRKLVEYIADSPAIIISMIEYYMVDRHGYQKLAKLSKSLKRGIAEAMTRLNRGCFVVAKGTVQRVVSFKDVIAMVHPVPKNQSQSDLFKELAHGKLDAPEEKARLHHNVPSAETVRRTASRISV